MTFHISAIFLLEGTTEPETLSNADTMQQAVELAWKLAERYRPPDYWVRVGTRYSTDRRERDAIRAALVLLGVAGEVI